MFTTYKKEDLESLNNNNPTIVETPEEELVTKYEIERCLIWIKSNGFKKTCLQFPQNLLNDATSVALHMQRYLGRPVFVIADTSYGSCCVDAVAAEHVKADSIIHFGHACLSPVTKIPLLYIYDKKELDTDLLIGKLDIFEEEPILIFYEDCYHHLKDEFQTMTKAKKNLKIASLTLDEFNEDLDRKAYGEVYPSLDELSRKILTRSESGNEIDDRVVCGRVFRINITPGISAVYIGDESITLQNLILNLPEFTWYRYTSDNEIIPCEMDLKKFLMQRNHLVEKVKEAKAIGILIATLGIKNFLDAVERIKKLAKSRGKKCYMLAVGKPSVEKLANFPEIDVFVCVACQENSLLKNCKDYYKPIVSILEVERALADRPIGLEYTSDFREILPGGSLHLETNIDIDPNNRLFETAQDLLERDDGSVVESRGAEYLRNRTWRGLEQNIGESEVSRAVPGRSGTAQAYENELSTLNINK